jgi:hypothetical protein
LRVEAIKETVDEYVKEIIYAKAKQDAEAVYAAVKDMISAGVSLSIECKALEVA